MGNAWMERQGWLVGRCAGQCVENGTLRRAHDQWRASDAEGPFHGGSRAFPAGNPVRPGGRRRRDQIELHLATADAYFRTDARTSALRAFTRAIVLSTKREIYRPLFQALPARRLPSRKYAPERARPHQHGRAWNAYERLFDARPFWERSRAAAHFQGVAAPPTPREIGLLHCNEAGLDNAQIAERLSVSVRTIKWRLPNLYFKLDVKNRSAAVAKGRSLRLLP